MLHVVLEHFSPFDDSIIHTEHLYLTREEYEERTKRLSNLQEIIVLEEDIL